MAVIAFLLFIFLFFGKNAQCFLSESDRQAIAAVFADKSFSGLKLTDNLEATTLSSGKAIDLKEIKYSPSTAELHHDTKRNTEGNLVKRYTVIPQKHASSSEESTTNRYEEEDPEGPPDHEIPYSEHENPKDISTRPKYTAPGEWAKPPPDKDIPLDFVPTTLYAQVRASHTVKRVPQEEAIEAAETEEEKKNAARLREVVSNSKVATVYTEEGYEDSAYDHAGHARDADFHEGYARKLANELDQGAHVKNKKESAASRKKSKFDDTDEYSNDYRDHVSDSSAAEEMDIRKEGNLPQANRKDYYDTRAENTHKEILNDREIHPKVVTEYEIEKLDGDSKNGNKDAEKGSEIYGAEKLTRSNDKYDYDRDDSVQSQELREASHPKKAQTSNGNDNRDTESEQNSQSERTTGPIYTVRPRRKPDLHQTKLSQKNPKIPDRKRKNYDSAKITTNKSDLSNYIHSTNIPTVDYAFSTLEYSSATEVPTTINYGEVFWNFFKERQNQRAVQPDLFREETTLNPDSITLATLNGHGPYLMGMKSRESTLTPNPLESFIEPGMINNLAVPNIEAKSAQWSIPTLQQTGNEGLFHEIASTTLFPLLSGPGTESWGPKNDQYNAKVLLSGFAPVEVSTAVYSSTPGYSVLTATENNINSPTKKTYYDHNPFLGPYARKSKVTLPRYAVLTRKHAGTLKAVDSTPEQSSSTDAGIVVTPVSVNYENQRALKPNENYKKMLRYLENQQKSQITGVNARRILTPDLTSSQLPPPRQISSRDAEHFLPEADNNIINQSTMTQENKKPQNIVRANSIQQFANQIGVSRVPAPNAIPVGWQRFPVEKPRLPPYKTQLFSLLHLLPPSPRSKSEYAEYRVRSRRSNRLPSRQKQIIELNSHENPVTSGLLRFVAKLQIRSKRSSEEKKSNFIHKTNVQKSNRASLEGTKADLLNESPRIADEVIDKEIKARFKDAEKVETNNSNKSTSEERDEVEIEIPEFDYVEEFDSDNDVNISTTSKPVFDLEKYPFYGSDTDSSFSTLKYVVDPKRVPRKTLGGMEFYDSRNDYLACDDVEPNLKDVAPQEEEPVPNRGLKEDLPRLGGLGDKLNCFRAKYFDKNPFDNPLFQESRVEQPKPPTELNLKNFATRVLELSPEKDDYISLKISKKPETLRSESRISNTPLSNYGREQSIQVNYNRDPKTGRGNNASFHSVRRLSSPNKKVPRGVHHRKRYGRPRQVTTDVPITTNEDAYATTPYQTEVYADVMGTIHNLENIYETITHEPPSATSVKSTTESTVNAASVTIPTLQIYLPDIPHTKAMRFIPDSLRQRNTGIPLIDITEKPIDIKQTNIEGLMAPPKVTRIVRTSPYKKKFAYRMRVKPNPSSQVFDGDMFPGHYRVLHINKRSIRDEILPNVKARKKFKRSVDYTEFDLSPSESNLIANNKFNDSFFDSVRRKRKPNVSAIVSSRDETMKPDNVSRTVVYTIKDRIRHSKPKGEYGKHGQFTTEPKLSNFDSRRLEPRYNPIKTKNISEAKTPGTHTTSRLVTSNSTVLNDLLATVPVDKPNITIIVLDNKPNGRNNIENAQRREAALNDEYPFKRKKRVYNDSTENSEEVEKSTDSSLFDDGDVKEPRNKYDVREDLSEEKPHAQLINYLQSDPPGYAEAFHGDSDETEESPQDKNSSKSEKEEQRDDGEEDVESYGDDTSEHSEEDKEESASEPEAKEEEGEHSSSVKSKDISEEDRTFERYDSRPFSPPEIYEDDKYSDLGPRINKPAFYHPPFVVPEYERAHLGRIVDRSDDEHSKESESSEAYEYPWEKDEEEVAEKKGSEEEEGEESRHFSNVLKTYEYPWQKRDRLARENRMKEKKYDRQRKYAVDTDGYTSTSEKKEKYAFPWDSYYGPSEDFSVTAKTSFWNYGSNSDNTEATTEYHPVTTFSSKQRFRPSNDVNSLISDNEKDFVFSSLAQDSVKSTVNPSLPVPRGFTKQLTGEQILSSTTPMNMLAASGRRIPGTNIVPELVTNAPKRKQKERIAWNNKNKTGRNPQSSSTQDSMTSSKVKHPRINLKLRGANSNSDKLSLRTEPTKSSSPPTATDPAARNIRRRGSIKNNSANFKAKQIDSEATTAKPKRKRGRPEPTATSATSTVSTRPRTLRRKSTVARSFTTNRGNKRAISKNVLSAPRSTSSSIEDDPDFQFLTPSNRTVEHRSRVSKEEIITKTVYPDVDTPFDKSKSSSESQDGATDSQFSKAPFTRVKIRRRERVNDDSLEAQPAKEKVEKVSITMTETPDHIYQTREIDKDGVKGTFITIIPHNDTVTPSTLEDDLHIKDTEVEELKRRMKDSDANLDSNQKEEYEGTTELGNVLTTDSYVLGNLLRNIPLTSREEDKRMESRETSGESDFRNRKPEEDQQEVETNEGRPKVKFINDPNKRMYYYAERRK